MNNRLSVIVAGALAGVLLLAVAGIVLLSSNGDVVPDILENIAVGALTALGALLARVGGDPVEVKAPAGQPLAVKEAEPGPTTLHRQPTGEI